MIECFPALVSGIGDCWPQGVLSMAVCGVDLALYSIGCTALPYTNCKDLFDVASSDEYQPDWAWVRRFRRILRSGNLLRMTKLGTDFYP